jgi:hypothetical protein
MRDLVSVDAVVNATLSSYDFSECLVGSGNLYNVNQVIRSMFSHAGLDFHDFVEEDLSVISPRRMHSFYAKNGSGCDTLGWMLGDLSYALSMRGLTRGNN